MDVLYTSFFLIGSILAYFGFNEYQKTKSLLATGTKTTATVIDLVMSTGDDGPNYSPVFEFIDRARTTQTFKSSVSSNPAAYDLGEKVKIIYDPQDAEEVKTISFWGLYRVSVVLCMMAAPLLILGGSYWLYSQG